MVGLDRLSDISLEGYLKRGDVFRVFVELQHKLQERLTRLGLSEGEVSSILSEQRNLLEDLFGDENVELLHTRLSAIKEEIKRSFVQFRSRDTHLKPLAISEERVLDFLAQGYFAFECAKKKENSHVDLKFNWPRKSLIILALLTENMFLNPQNYLSLGEILHRSGYEGSTIGRLILLLNDRTRGPSRLLEGYSILGNPTVGWRLVQSF